MVKQTTKKPRKKLYFVEVETTGQTYKAKAETIEDALAKINLTWEQIKLKGIVRVKYGKQFCEKLYQVVPLRRIFINETVRSIQSNFLHLLLTEKAAPNE